VTTYTTSKTRSIPGAWRGERGRHTLVVEDEGKDYKTILSSLRSKIRNVSAGHSIRSVRSTRGGKLLVTTGKSDEDLEVLSRVISAPSRSSSRGR
jgi:hypothetical protein